MAGYRNGWSYSGDEVCLRDISMFYRQNYAEAVKDISTALKMKEKKWMAFSSIQPTADVMLNIVQEFLRCLVTGWHFLRVARIVLEAQPYSWDQKYSCLGSKK